MTPLVYKKSKKSDKILIETKNLSKGLFTTNIITQNIRYYPHDLNTKFYAVCRVTIDVRPFIYKKGDKSSKT